MYSGILYSFGLLVLINDCYIQIVCTVIIVYISGVDFLQVATVLHNRPISQIVVMSSIAINRAEHLWAIVIFKHNYTLMCNHKIVINIMLCLLNRTGHI